MGTPSHAALITEQQERTAARRTPGAVDPLLSVWTCQQRPRQSPMFAVRVSARKCMQQLHSWETSLNEGGSLAPSNPYHYQTIRSLPHHASPPAQQSIHMTPPPPYPFLPHTSPEQLTAQASSETSRKVAILPALQERKHTFVNLHALQQRRQGLGVAVRCLHLKWFQLRVLSHM